VEEVCKKIAKQKEISTILIVGHNPFLVNLVNYIINSGNGQNLSLKTGGLVKIKILSLEPQLKGDLEWLLPPKLIRKISK